MLLAAGAGKLLPLVLGLGVLRNGHVALELEDTLWGSGGALGLSVEEDVPDTGSRVLGVAGAVGVDKELLAGGVGAEEGHEAVGADGLVLEQADEVVGGLEGAGEELRVLYGRVLAADVGLDAGAQRADDGRDRGAHLDEVRHGDGLEAELGVVLCVPGLHLVSHLLESVVLGQAQLVVEADGAVGAALEALRRGLLGPAGGVVEAEADGLARPLGAAAGTALEELGHVVGDVLPDAAGVLAALGALESWDGTCPSDITLSCAVAQDDSLDIFGDGGKLAILKSQEIANEFV